MIFMSQEVMNIVETCVISPLLIALTSYIITFLHKQIVKLQAQIKDEKIKNLISIAEGIVDQAVSTVTQTYVDGLKEEGVFDKDAQKTAFEKSKTYVYSLMTEETKNAITENYGTLDTWVSTKIEEFIAKSK